MAMGGTERSKALHNFTLPCNLKWGNQKFLRCMKVNSNGQISALHRSSGNNDSDHQHQHHSIQRRSAREREKDSAGEFLNGSTKTHLRMESFGGRKFKNDKSDDDDGIAAMREKVMFDLQTAADKMKDAIFKESLEDNDDAAADARPPPPPPPPPPLVGNAQVQSDAETARPWNLRTRRAACKSPLNGFASVGGPSGVGSASASTAAGGGKGFGLDVMKPSSGFSSLRVAADNKSSPRLRSGGSAAAPPLGEKRERAKFSVALSRQEIEEDFMAMVSHRPPRRPKKRTRHVQKDLDTLFPGLWLTEVTVDKYKVPETAP